MRVETLREFATGVLSLLYPPHCALCNHPLASEAPEPVCQPCWEALPLQAPPWCTGCGRSLAGTGLDVTRCQKCRSRRSPIGWARAACRYEGPAKTCVLQLKYHAQLALAAPMARQMVAVALAPPRLTANALVPVPLHPARERERQFNQASVLAQAVGIALGLPVLHGVLVRQRPTAPQATLEAAERRRNVARAFAAGRTAEICGRTLVLIDDVVTTGETAVACAKALKAAGAADVGLLTFAHG